MGADYFDYMRPYITDYGETVKKQLRTSDGNEINEYPVEVKNIEGTVIGTANNKEEYIDIWNRDAANRTAGELSGSQFPFFFNLKKRPTAPVFEWVDGNPVGGDVYDTMYDNVYA